MASNENTEEPLVEEDLSTVELPQWLAELLPEPREPVVIDFIDNKYTVYNPVSEITQKWGSIEQAYENAHDHTIDDKGVGGIVFTHNAVSYDERLLGDVIILNRKGVGSGRILFGYTDKKDLDSLKSSYKKWLEYVPAYEANPHDFITAYSFIDSHPALWTKENWGEKRNKIDHMKPYRWKTSGFAMGLWHMPRQEEDGSVFHMMEAGSHVPPEYISHYHDFYLEVYDADSYENAIIEMAANIHKFFHPDGTEREGVRADEDFDDEDDISRDDYKVIPVGDD